jgi:protein-S-isoprenylcysteine O-methyltransferase Ste14
VLPYFLSLEHLKLEEKYGKQQGKRIGAIFGMISGWGFFLFWFGIWLSPQDRFLIPFFQDFSIHIPILNMTIYLVNFLIFIPFFIVGAWFGIKGVIQTSLRVAETHRADRVVSTGVYSIVRHPQYFGGILAHIGFSFLLSGLYSLLVTPLVIAVVYIISWKEEKELLREFGQEYEDYKSKVSMLIPKVHSHKRIS